MAELAELALEPNINQSVRAALADFELALTSTQDRLAEQLGELSAVTVTVHGDLGVMWT